MVSKSDIERALQLLEKDVAKNISFINFIRNYEINYLHIIDDSVMARGRSDHEWVYISCRTKEVLGKLIELVPVSKHFAVLEEWMVPIVAADREIEWELKTRRYFLPEEISILSENNLSPLSLNDAEYIYGMSKYKDFLSIEYIEERIRKGISCGIREDNMLVAWAITQDDDAIGFLNVLNEYRRQGLAQKILLYMADKLRDHNKIPFAYIEDSNSLAVNLCLKLGFVSDRLISWIKIRDAHK